MGTVDELEFECEGWGLCYLCAAQLSWYCCSSGEWLVENAVTAYTLL